MSELHFEEVVQDKQKTIKLKGNINEYSVFQEIDVKDINELVIDLAGIEMINSVGIRDWIRWMEKIPNSVQVTFRACSKAIVDQINILNGFLPHHAEVESFYVPFYCEKCGRREQVLFRRGEEFIKGTADRALPTLNFPKLEECGGEDCCMELDALEGKYFRFLHYRRD